MIWRNNSNGVIHVLINNVHILSKKAKKYCILGLPNNAASQDFFDNILAL